MSLFLYFKLCKYMFNKKSYVRRELELWRDVFIMFYY